VIPAAGNDVVAATALVRVDGHPAGSAVLVDERHLLTAWHVAALSSDELQRKQALSAELRVLFPQLGEEAFEVAVLDLPKGAVDLAVLDLVDRRLPVAPVRMWAGRRLPGEVSVFGYPLAEGAPNGVWRDFTVSGATTTGLRQLVWDEGAGGFPGHSGGPVVDAQSGALVGILSSGSLEGRFDRFLPVTKIETVWKGLRRPWLYAGEDAWSHVRRRAAGPRGHTFGGDLFKGRVTALEAIDGWLAVRPGPGRPLVITGQPGAGKSSVLARAMLKEERTYGCRGLVFHARAATASQFLDTVAAAMDVPAGAAQSVADLLDHEDTEEDSEDSEKDPFPHLVIAVDALDEAANAEQRSLIATALAELARRPRITAVVATRPLSAGNRYRPGNLLPQLGVSSATSRSLIDLDVSPYRDPQALLQLTTALLTQENARHPGPAGCAWEDYRVNSALTGHLARIVADRAGRSFLVAALTATALSTADELVDPYNLNFDPAGLPTTIGEAIEKYLTTLSDTERARIRGILTALAHARGPGITDQLWLRFIAALGYSADRSTLDALRDSTAADYLLQTTAEDDELVSRLFHQALVDQLLQGRSSRGDYRAILQAVLSVVSEGGGWSASSSYARAYAADHAVEAGQLIDVLNDSAFVLNVDPDRLAAATATLSRADRTPTGTVILQHGTHAATVPRKARPFFLALAATHLGLRQLADEFLAGNPASVRPRWAHALGSSHQRLTGHTKAVTEVAVGRLGDQDVIISRSVQGVVLVWDAAGSPIKQPARPTDLLNAVSVAWRNGPGYGSAAVRVRDSAVERLLTGHSGRVNAVAVGRLGTQEVIVSGDNDGTLRVWDAGDKPVGNPLTGHTGPVNAVAVGRLGARDVIVSGSNDGTVRIWDPAGRPVGELIGHTGPVTAVAVGRLGARDVIVSGSNDGTVRVWDAADKPVGNPLAGHTDHVNAVAVGRLGTQEVIVSGDNRGTLRVWDVAGKPVGSPLTGHTGPVKAVAVGRLGHDDVIFYGSSVSAVQVRSVDGSRVPGLIGHNSWINALAVGRLGARDVIASGSNDGTVRVWDVAGKPVGNPLAGHTGPVNALTVGELGDRDVIVSGSNDGTVRVWDVAGKPVGNPLAGHTDHVTAVAVGRLGTQEVIVSGDNDGTLRVWDVAGKPVGSPLTGHTGPVNAVAVGRFGDGDVIVSGSNDSTVQIWDIAGSPVGQPLHLVEPCTGLALMGCSVVLSTGFAVVLLESR
jgi:WD40 repeat protein